MTNSEILKDLKSVFNIVNTFLESKGFSVDNDLYEECYKLIKKDARMKPLYDSREESYSCPCCNKDFGYDNYDYCPDCGQHINWSDT